MEKTKMFFGVLAGLLIFAASGLSSISSAYAACDLNTAVNKAYGLLEKMQADHNVTNLSSNISDTRSSIRNGKYDFLFTFDNDSGKMVVVAYVDAQTCNLEEMRGANVLNVNLDGTDK